MAEQQQPNGSGPVTNGNPDGTTPPGIGGVLPETAESLTEKQKATFLKSPEVARFWEAVKRLPAYTRFVAAVVRDPEVPRQAKVVLGIGGAYAVSPIDLVPGVIPVAGQMDDLYALLTGIQQSLRMMPADVAQKHLDAAKITPWEIDGDLASTLR